MNIEDITKEDFEAYESVRKSGMVNMISSQVQDFAGIDKETHLAIMKHYSDLDKKWPEVREEE